MSPKGGSALWQNHTRNRGNGSPAIAPRCVAAYTRVSVPTKRLLHSLDEQISYNSYVQHNPNHLSDADLAILMGWKNAIANSFIVLRHLKSGSIFIPTSATDAAYIVSGIYSPWDEMLRGAPLPQVIDAVLIPFENKIICDSVIAPYRVRLVGQMRSSMNDHYRVLKASGRVFKTFPDKG